MCRCSSGRPRKAAVLHVAHDAVGVGGALDEQFAGAQEQVELPAENLFGVMRLRVSHWV